MLEGRTPPTGRLAGPPLRSPPSPLLAEGTGGDVLAPLPLLPPEDSPEQGLAPPERPRDYSPPRLHPLLGDSAARSAAAARRAEVGQKCAAQLDEWRSAQPQCLECTTGRWKRSPLTALVVAICVCTYLAYVVFNDDRSPVGVACVAVFHVLLVLTLLALAHAVAIDPGTVPRFWHEAVEGTAGPGIPQRYPTCRKCKLYKPPRSHFDAVQQRLTLNMDHYCPWVANTVGFYNRKFFILFVVYAGLACGWVAVTMAAVFTDQVFPLFGHTKDAEERAADRTPRGVRVLWGGVFLVDAMVAVLLLFFGIAHCQMAVTNSTTIERRGSDYHQYDLGCAGNFEQIFGVSRLLWFIPLWAGGPGDGFGGRGDGVRWRTSDGGTRGNV